MLKRKLAISVAAFALASAVAGIYTGKEYTVHAAESVQLTSAQAELFLPHGSEEAGYTAYEQYLPLVSPSDIAFCDDYIAVADGDTLYVYDRAEGTYASDTVEEGRTISKIGFTAEGRLFVSDTGAGNRFYEYDYASGELKRGSINFSTFCIDGDSLYTATVAGGVITLSRYSIASLDGGSTASEQLGTILGSGDGALSLTCLYGVLYCTVGISVYYPNESGKFDNDTAFFIANSPALTQGVQSVHAYGGYLYYTASQGIYRTDTSGNAVHISPEGETDFTALTSCGDKLYCVKDASVREYALSEDGKAVFTGYEICSSSSSEGRLSEAVGSVRAGGLLVTADKGNDRISVYDFATGSYSLLDCEDVSLVATDGSIVVAAADDSVYLYETTLDGFSEPTVFEGSDGYDVTGIACIHGAVYYVTRSFHYHKITKNGNTWTDDDSNRFDAGIPAALVSNLYGDLFVISDTGDVRAYTEDNFIAGNVAGERIGTLPSGYSSVRAGFDGTLYYLDAQKRLCRFVDGTDDEILASIDGDAFVYRGEEEAGIAPVSFALGFEDDCVWFNFGDFLVKTHENVLGFATLESVSRTELESVREEISAVKDPQDGLSLIRVSRGAVGVRVALSALVSEEPTPYYSDYIRTTDRLQGVLLAETEKYRLIALYENGEYVVQLFRISDTETPVPVELEAPETAQMYLSSACYPFYFSCIADAPARAENRLARGTLVTVLSVVRQEAGLDFAYVQYQTEARTAAYGYVPLSFLTEVNPSGTIDEHFLFGYLKSDKVFTAEDGTELPLEKGAQVRLYANEDGTYTARYTSEGVEYTAQLTRGEIDWGESDAWRISLIIGLTVVAVLIVGAYIFLLPRKQKRE